MRLSLACFMVTIATPIFIQAQSSSSSGVNLDSLAFQLDSLKSDQKEFAIKSDLAIKDIMHRIERNATQIKVIRGEAVNGNEIRKAGSAIKSSVLLSLVGSGLIGLATSIQYNDPEVNSTALTLNIGGLVAYGISIVKIYNSGSHLEKSTP